MKKISALLLAAILSMTMLVSLAATPEANLAAETSLNNAEAAADAAAMSAETVADNASHAYRNAFNGAFADLFAQLDTLRATVKTNYEAVKAINAQIKTAMANFKNTVKTLPADQRDARVGALTATLAPMHQSAIQLHADMKKLRADKSAQWVNYRIAVRAKNQAAAETALRSIISLKAGIVEKQTALLAVKQQILAAITAA